MRLLIPLVSALMACASTAPDAGIQDQGGLDAGALDAQDGGVPQGTFPLTVLSWNVQTFPKDESTVNTLAELINTRQPDLIGLQEIAQPNAFDALLDAIPGYAGAQVFDPDNFLRVGIIYKTDRVSVSDIEALFLEDWYPFPRPPLKAKVRIRTATTSTTGGSNDPGPVIFDFIFVVLHLKAQRDARSEARRRLACVMLDEWVEETMREGERDFIMVGDYNDRITDAPPNNVFTVFFEKADTYTFLTQEVADRGGSSYIPFPGLIDHILITNDALLEYGEGSTSVLLLDEELLEYESVISDHRPVMSRFLIPYEPDAR